MNVHARPRSVNLHGDASIADLFAALEPHDAKPLVLAYAGRTIRPGYHITEVKVASFSTLDCGGNPDQWQETILQVEDSGLAEEQTFMPVRKFRSILAHVGTKVAIDPNARVTFEIGLPGEPMQVFDVATITAAGEQVAVSLAGRPAICKPRHREARRAVEASCCAGRADRLAAPELRQQAIYQSEPPEIVMASAVMPMASSRQR
jgi:hypothetical protein